MCPRIPAAIRIRRVTETAARPALTARASTSKPEGPDPFVGFAFRMGRYWFLLSLAMIMVTLSGLTLSVGLLGALPVIDSILGTRKGLPELAVQFNKSVVSKPAVPDFLQIPQEIIDRMPTTPFTALVWIMVGLAVLTVVGSIANFLHAFLSQTVVNRTVTGLRREAFHTVLRAPVRFLTAEGPADMISRIVNDTAQLANGLTVMLSKAVLQIFKGVAALAVAFTLDWRVTAAALVVAPVLYTIIRKLGKRIKRYSGMALESQAALYSAANESLMALRVVKVHTTERFEGGRFHHVNKRMLRELNRVRTARALASPLTEALSIFLLCGLVLVAAGAIVEGNINPGVFILALGSLAVAGASLKPLTGIVNDIQTAAPAATRLRELLDMKPEPGHGRGLSRLPRHSQSIEFRSVRVSYSDRVRPAIDRVTLSVRHGQRVALVGPNGSGKSTLLGLVPRLFDPDEGRVVIDGIDIRDVSVRSLRNQIGMVAQETVLFQGTMRSNIAYGTSATDERIIEAAKKARAHEFIMSLPHGYDTAVAAQGQSLSGGQRQRIAIARAILRDPAILILDEATSMIDADSEAQIAAALAEFSIGRTCLVVAHRLSTVLTCDKIAVLDKGKLVDQGTHQELIERCEVYRQLAKHQFLVPVA